MKPRSGLIARLASRWRDLPLVAEALVAVALAGLAVKLLSFNQILAFVGRPPKARHVAAAQREVIGARIGWAVPASARRLPWKATCFPQGIAAQWMLRRRGIAGTFHYGASILNDSLEAHVWVMDGERAIVGGREAPLMRTLVQVTAGEGAPASGRVA
jgi:hypothetical protein